MVGGAFCVRGSVRGVEYNFKEEATLIASNGLIIDESKTAKEIAKDCQRQFREIEKLYTRANAENLRTKIVLSPPKEKARFMTDSDWDKLAQDYFKKMGIKAEEHPYYIKKHTDTKNPHIHIEISCINFRGERAIKSDRIGENTGKACNKIAKERGWRTAQEIKADRLKDISKDIKDSANSSKDFSEFEKKMNEKDYKVKFYENEAKGVYGMRIVPNDQIVENPSPRKNKAGEGYKLSEIQKNDDKKAKWNINDIKEMMRENLKKEQEQRQNPYLQKIQEIKSKSDQEQEKNKEQKQTLSPNSYYEKIQQMKQKSEEEQDRKPRIRR